jgi:hypothetical protein
MSSANGGERRRVGQASKYLLGGENSLVHRPPRPGENLERVGEWSRERLIKMDQRFCAAVERAFRLGRENRASASADMRAGAGDRDRLAS